MSGLMASADRHLTKTNLGQLREICRMHDRQSALMSGLLDRALDNIFGDNFDFIPASGDVELDKLTKQYITNKMSAERASASGENDFIDIARTSLRAVWTDGDVLLAKRPDGTLLPFEADQVETPSGRSAAGPQAPRAPGGGAGGNGDKRIVLGVELNNVNKHIAYYIKPRPSRGDSGMVRLDAGSQRIIRRDVIFPAYRKRHNQTRGVPFLAAALGTYDRTDNWLDNESLTAEGNAMLGWKIKKEPAADAMGGVADNEDTSTNTTFEQVQKMQPFQVFELAMGEDLEMIGSNRPGSNFEPYLVTCCRVIGVAVGMPLELFMLDFSKTNYSSARASLGEARRGFRVWQRFAQNKICLPWFQWQISRGIASGELPAKSEIYRVRFQWPRWEYLDPAKSAKGNETDMGNMVKSPQECIREQGWEPAEVADEIAEWQRMLDERGIKKPPPKNDERETAEDEDEDDEDERKQQNE
jgi:lambda family phage portal protein